MPFLHSGSARIHYDVHGEPTGRPPLLLSHGFCASGRMWDCNVGALAGDRQVLTWDMRGHARSDCPAEPSEYGVEQSIQDMLLLRGVLDVPRVVLGGMSLGGYLSLAFHARHPELVAALILVDAGPGFRRDEPRQELNAFAERTAAALERDGLAALPASPEVGKHRDAIGLANTARLVVAQHDAHVFDSLQGIAVPTLVVVGARDTSFLSAADCMAAKIPGARKVVLEGAGHAANIDAAEAFNTVIREFLEEI
ncbi:MAG: alpha/beta fold hydrolase [Solirubrobacteraceae bacterium]